MKIETYIVTK